MSEADFRVRVRVQWGGFTAYMDKGLFPYCWDGGLSVQGGRVAGLEMVRSRLEAHHYLREDRMALDQPAWQSRTDNGMEGVRFDVHGDDRTEIEVVTVQKTIRFSLGALRKARFLRWPVGAKYSGQSMVALIEGEGAFDVFAPVAQGAMDVRLRGTDVGGAARVGLFKTRDAAWIAPGKTARAVFRLPRAPRRGTETRSAFELNVRAALADNERTHFNTHGSQDSPVLLQINGRPLPVEDVHFRCDSGVWREVQWIESIQCTVPAAWLRPGENRPTIGNGNREKFLVVDTVQLREHMERDGECLAAPHWLLCGESFGITLRCMGPHDAVRVVCRNARLAGDVSALASGEQRLDFVAGDRPETAVIRVRAGRKDLLRVDIPVYAATAEKRPWLVGATLEHVRLDASRQADRIIETCRDTRTANYLLFRLEPTHLERCRAGEARPEDWRRWGALLKESRMHTGIISGHAWKGYDLDNQPPWPPAYEAARALQASAGKYMHCLHVHEFTRTLYGCVPPRAAALAPEENTMTAADRRFRAYVSRIEGVPGIPMQAGEAAPVAAYDAAAGIGILSMETMALHALRAAMGRVWGKFGGTGPEWAYGDPERGMELMDVFMPYWQDGHHIRHWFSGTPYGPFDLTPVAEAPDEVLRGYALLVFLGWNTMTVPIHDRLKTYVKQGGTLFLGLPHLSQHAGRGFLETMDDLDLMHGGDLRALCGVRVRGAAPAGVGTSGWVKGSRAAAVRADPEYFAGRRPAPLRLADIELHGARPLITEEETGRPLLVEHRLGRGRVWLLTAWAYPGHPLVQPLVRDVLHRLGACARRCASAWVEDPSGEVAHACWRHTGERRLHLLNTDWTESGNAKPCRVHIGRHTLPVTAVEGRLHTVAWRGALAVMPGESRVNVVSITGRGDRYRVMLDGHGRCAVTLCALGRKITGCVRTPSAASPPRGLEAGIPWSWALPSANTRDACSR